VTEGPDTIVAAFTVDQAAKLTGVSRRQLDAWNRDGFFSPSITYEAPGPFSRMYSFKDLLSLKVLHQIRNETRVSMSHLKEVKAELAHLGEDLWLNSTLYLLGRRIVIERDDETRHEAGSGQEVFRIPLRVVVGGIKERITDFNQRTTDEIGTISHSRFAVQNRPVMAGTRIPVSAIKEFHASGYSVEQISREYPSLTVEDIEAAIRYEEQKKIA